MTGVLSSIADKLARRKMTLSELKDLLRDLKQPLSGSKSVLLERLIEFSGKPSAWNL